MVDSTIEKKHVSGRLILKILKNKILNLTFIKQIQQDRLRN